MASEVLIFMSATISGHIKILVEPRASNKGSKDSPGEQKMKEDKAVSLVCVLNIHFRVRSNRKVYFPQGHQPLTCTFLSSGYQRVGHDPLVSNKAFLGVEDGCTNVT